MQTFRTLNNKIKYSSHISRLQTTILQPRSHHRDLQPFHYNINQQQTKTATTTTTTHDITSHQRLHYNRPEMADDDTYSTFLSKANADPKSGSTPSQPKTSTSQSRSKYDPTESTAAIPASLRSLPDTPYISDTDSDWEVVFFNYAADDLPTPEQFTQVLKSDRGSAEQGDVEELEIADFDPKGQYSEVVERVRKAGEEGTRGKSEGGEKGVKVFRVQVTKTRVEYYVLTVGERKLVGVVAKAVES